MNNLHCVRMILPTNPTEISRFEWNYYCFICTQNWYETTLRALIIPVQCRDYFPLTSIQMTNHEYFEWKQSRCECAHFMYVMSSIFVNCYSFLRGVHSLILRDWIHRKHWLISILNPFMISVCLIRSIISVSLVKINLQKCYSIL